MSNSALDANDCMIIGYYPIRGKAQMCRLLCQYLHLPYRDLLFTPKTWEQFKEQQKLNWTFQQLPFLKDGDTIITETYPICLYLLYKACQKNLLGANLLQQIKIDTQIWKIQPASYLFTALVNHRDYTSEVRTEVTNKLWTRFLREKLTKLQNEALGQFFFENITLIDFYLYETVYFLQILCPEKLVQFPKLALIFNRVFNLIQIKSYQQSKKAIKQVCPIAFCINWRQKCGNKNA